MANESEMWYPSPELKEAVDIVQGWMNDYDLAFIFDAERKKSPLLDLAERIRAAESAAVAEERKACIQEAMRLSKEPRYTSPLRWRDACQYVAAAIRSRASGGNGGGEEGDGG